MGLVLISSLKISYCIKDISVINIFVHWINYTDVGSLNKNSNYNRMVCDNKKVNVKWYGYTTADGGQGAINVVRKVIQLIKNNNTEDICQELAKEMGEAEKKIKQEEAERHLTLLLHRIAHLFLPMDIDLQGILECWNDRGKDIAKKYLQEVLNEKSNGSNDNSGNSIYYRQKLANLWYMVIKGRIENGVWSADDKEKEIENGSSMVKCSSERKVKCVFVPPCDDVEELLASKKFAIIDLIIDRKEDEEIKEHWKTLLEICGLHFDKDDPFKKEEIYPLPDSPILQFMCYMDCLIKNREQLNDIIIEKIYDSSSPLFQYSIIPQPSSNPFHQWFCKVMKMLEEIRNNLGGD